MEPDTRGDFSRRSVPGNIARLAVPMTAALLVNVFYSMVDRIFIGHIPLTGSDALTGIGLTFPIIMLVSAFQSLCSSGAVPLFSMARGRGDNVEAERVMGCTFVLLLLFSIVLLAVMFPLKRPLLILIGASPRTLPYADAYLSLYLLGTPFVMLALGLNPFLNAQGFPRIGMATVLLGACINLALDPILIFGLQMGVRGAALATVVAQCISALWAMLFLMSSRSPLRLRLSCLRLELARTSRILSLGTSGFAVAVTNSAVSIVCNTQLAAIGGDLWVGAMSIVKTLAEVTFQPLHGVTSGAQPVLGYNYGAHAYDRVRRAVLWTSGICVVCTATSELALMICAPAFARLFTPDAALIDAAVRGMRLYFCLYVFLALQMSGQNTFLALGMTRYALTFTMLRKGALLIPLILILPRVTGLGVMGVFLAEPISDLIGGCACYLVMYCRVYRRLQDAAAERT